MICRNYTDLVLIDKLRKEWQGLINAVIEEVK